MVLWIASRRWAWVKYPIYDYDEKEDNLDNDPTEPRNTTMTLAQELAACHESLMVFEVDPLPLPLLLPSPPVSIAHDHHRLDETPNHPKACIGEVFCKKLAMVKAAREREENGLRDRQKCTNFWSGSAEFPQPTNRKKEFVSSRRSAPEPTRRPESSGPGFQFTGSSAPISFLPDRYISLGQFIARNPYEPWKGGGT